MEIERVQTNNIEFKELKCGDVFEMGESVYLKIDNGNYRNAYDLVLNRPAFLKENEEVIKLQSKLTVW